jgi:putative flippase GtrA
VLVGATAFIVEYSSFYIFFTELHWRLILANSLSFIFGLLVSFTAQRFWTFASKEKMYSKPIRHQASLYVLLSFFNLLISTLIIETLVHVSLKPLIAKFSTQIVVAFWNYFILKRIIFTLEI